MKSKRETSRDQQSRDVNNEISLPCKELCDPFMLVDQSYESMTSIRFITMHQNGQY